MKRRCVIRLKSTGEYLNIQERWKGLQATTDIQEARVYSNVSCAKNSLSGMFWRKDKPEVEFVPVKLSVVE